MVQNEVTLVTTRAPWLPHAGYLGIVSLSQDPSCDPLPPGGFGSASFFWVPEIPPQGRAGHSQVLLSPLGMNRVP